MTTADLYWTSVREYKQIPTGRMIKAGNGRMKPETVGREFVKTACGQVFEVEEWYKAMREAVEAEGLQEILEEIKMSCRRLAWLRTEKQIEEYALECLSLRQQRRICPPVLTRSAGEGVGKAAKDDY